MLSDHEYDLINQLVQESQSLWRIKNTYKTDSMHCDKCLKFWEKMEKTKEANIEELTELIKEHLK
jgi:acid phosphatase class B